MQNLLKKNQNKNIHIHCLLLVIITTFCSTAEIVIDVEKLSKPTELLEIESFDDVIETENNLSSSDSTEAQEYRAGIVAKAKEIGNVVDFGFHPFFKGMYQAYAEHRPFTLSPDMLWLLICQGLSQHVNNNSETLRKHFVSFTEKVTLVVRDDAIF
ncbi:MAG TPA: DUF4419 domain-containing protein [Chitinispirillaceae bacterium]|nr:DUF4419 domain-containing protein [Chitinispirillaceae bacterium]